MQKASKDGRLFKQADVETRYHRFWNFLLRVPLVSIAERCPAVRTNRLPGHERRLVRSQEGTHFAHFLDRCHPAQRVHVVYVFECRIGVGLRAGPFAH